MQAYQGIFPRYGLSTHCPRAPCSFDQNQLKELASELTSSRADPLSKQHCSLYRLAIAANLCGYPKRLDAAQLACEGKGYTTSFLALAILNGDVGTIFSFTASTGSSCLKDKEAFSFSKNSVELMKDAEAFVYEVKPRFDCIRMSPAGIEAKAWVWIVNKEINLKAFIREQKGLRNVVSNGKVNFQTLPKALHFVLRTVKGTTRQGIPKLGFEVTKQPSPKSFRCSRVLG